MFVKDTGTCDIGRKRTFRCRQGHVFTTTGPWCAFDLTFVLDENNSIKTGTLCPTCIAEFLRKNFGAEELPPQKGVYR